MIDSEAVTWGYRLFLDREPESVQMIYAKAMRCNTFRQLRNTFLESIEFKRKNPEIVINRISGFEPKPRISIPDTDTELETLFAHVQAVWTRLGETEPHWSVLASDQFKKENIAAAKNSFYQSGRMEVERIVRTLERNDIDPGNLGTCLEYGCGLGRVTRWLAERFEAVHGIDISQAHLRSARDYLEENKINNVEFHHLKDVQDILRMPAVDFIYSRIVLQHNPPPIIELIIRGFMRALKPNGIAFFQVPVYSKGYEFDLTKYLKQTGSKNSFEMHALPQKRVFNAVFQEGGKVLEVFEENSCVGFGVSCFFLIMK